MCNVHNVQVYNVHDAHLYNVHEVHVYIVYVYNVHMYNVHNIHLYNVRVNSVYVYYVQCVHVYNVHDAHVPSKCTMHSTRRAHTHFIQCRDSSTCIKYPPSLSFALIEELVFLFLGAELFELFSFFIFKLCWAGLINRGSWFFLTAPSTAAFLKRGSLSCSAAFFMSELLDPLTSTELVMDRA